MTAKRVASSIEYRILIWTPQAADAATLCTTLRDHDLEPVVCVGLGELCQSIAAGAGSAVIAEEVMNDKALDALKLTLMRQPHWSDFPLVIMTQKRVTQEPDHIARTLEVVGQATLLERPVRTVTLVSAVRVALRSRQRQYQLRDRLRELTETAASLKAAERRAVSAAQAKSEFLATMSHELRTPMSAILGYAEILSASLTEAEDRQTLETIRRNGNYLLELLNDILDLSKIEAGRLPLWKERFDPTEVLAEVCSLMRVRAQARGLELRFQCEGLVPETIHADRKRLRQVLVNVIGNAVKFTETGSVDVTCRLDEGADEPELEIRVRDTGIGMSPDEISQVFEPFSRSGAARSRQIPGTGLGLSISKRLVEMLGGNLYVESERGVGTTFGVRIPTGSLERVRRVQCEKDLQSIAVPAPASEPSGELDGHILVVDDHRDVRDLVRRFLEDAGARVTLANDGGSALAKYEASQTDEFDAIVLDMQMPVLDGYRAARELRDRGYRGTILALTAAAMSGDREKCQEAGCDEHVTKPVTRSALIDTLHRLTRENAAVDRETTTAGEASPSLPHPKLLLVEDDNDVRMAFGLLLKSAGYDVELAPDGRSAVDRAESFRPDAVLIDIGLPDISGCEVAKRLRALPSLSDAVLIGLTGRDESAVQEGRFDAHLLKPATLEDVEKILAGNR